MQSFQKPEDDNQNIEDQAPDYILKFANNEDMTTKSFKIDHDLDEFDAIDLATLGVGSPEYIDELPKVEIGVNTEINYPSFENGLPGDKELQKYIGLQDNLKEKNLIYVNPNDEEQIRNLEDKGLIKNIFSMSQKQLRFVIQENTLYVIDPSVIGTNDQQLNSIEQLKLPSPDANFQYLQVDQLKRMDRGKDIYEALNTLDENQGQIINGNHDIMNQYVSEQNIVYHDETDNYALNPNVISHIDSLSDTRPYEHSFPSDFTGDQEDNTVQTVSNYTMMGVITMIVSIGFVLWIGVTIGQGKRNIKLEKQHQKEIEEQKQKIAYLEQKQIEQGSLQSGQEEKSDLGSARKIEIPGRRYTSSQFEEMQMSLQGASKTELENDGKSPRCRIQSDDNQFSAGLRVRENVFGISKKSGGKFGSYSHDNNSLKPRIIISAGEHEKSISMQDNSNYSSSIVESPEEQIDTNEIIIDDNDAQIVTDQSNIDATSKVVEMVPSSKEIKDTVIVQGTFETPPKLRPVPHVNFDEQPVSPELILGNDEQPDIISIGDINEEGVIEEVDAQVAPGNASTQIMPYSPGISKSLNFSNEALRQMMEQMNKTGGIPAAQLEKYQKMLTGKFLSQIEPKRADLQEIGFDAQRQEMFVQQKIYYDAPKGLPLSPRGQHSLQNNHIDWNVEDMSPDNNCRIMGVSPIKYSNGRPRYDAQQLCLPPCEPKECYTPTMKSEDNYLDLNNREHTQFQSLAIKRHSSFESPIMSPDKASEQETSEVEDLESESSSNGDSNDESENSEEEEKSSSDSQSSNADSMSSEENATTLQSQTSASQSVGDRIMSELEEQLSSAQMAPLSQATRTVSEISDESPLQNILDTGRFQKKFKDIDLIGQGGFGKVYKATYHVDQKQYAVKVVRLYIQKARGVDPMKEIYQHRVYRELQAASAITSENIVRYFSSWFEELNPEERLAEVEYREQFQDAMAKKKLQKKIRAQMSKNSIKSTNQSQDSPPFKMASSLKKKQKSRRQISVSGQSFNSSSDHHSQSFRKSLRKLSFGKHKPYHEVSIAKSIIMHKTHQMIHEDLDGENDTENEQNKTSFEAKDIDQQIQAEKSRLTQFSSNECKKKSSIMSLPKRSKSPETVSMISSELSKSVSNNSKKMNKKRSMSADKLEEVSDETSSEEESSSEEDSSSDDTNSLSSSEDESSLSNSSASIQPRKISRQTRSNRFVEKFVKSHHEESSKSSAISGYSQFSQCTLCNFLEKDQDFYSVNMMIQMEYCSGQSLENFLNKRNQKGKSAYVHEGGVINRSQNLEIFKHMVNGIAEIHKNNVLHRDLKPENIFINVDGQRNTAKIGDFGLARMLNPGSQEMESQDQYNLRRISLGSIKKTQSIFSTHFSSVAGTQAYMAPEIKTHFIEGTRPPKHRDVQINKSQDIYQLGLILYELSHKVTTHHLKTMLFRQLLESRTVQGPLKDHNKDIELEMIMLMTEMDPHKRPTCEELQRDYLPKWAQQINSEQSNQIIQPQEAAQRLGEEEKASQEEQLLQISSDLQADKTLEQTERAEVKPKLRLQVIQNHFD